MLLILFNTLSLSPLIIKLHNLSLPFILRVSMLRSDCVNFYCCYGLTTL